jgi:hypothetical protein
MSSPKKKVREKPRMTANELARYMVTGEVGRRGIVKRSKEPSTAVTVRYADVRQVLTRAICDPVNKTRIISDAHERFEQKASDTALSDWAQSDASKSIDVLEAFQLMSNQLAGFQFLPPPTSQSDLLIGGIPVSVNCDFLIQGTIKGKPYFGAGLFRLTAPDENETAPAKAKREDMGAYAASLVHSHATNSLATDVPVHHTLCWSIEVQGGEIHKAPKTYKKRQDDMAAACQFIDAIWPTL